MEEIKMRELKDFSKKDLGAVLYQYYLDNYCEDDFSFDEGRMRKQVEEHLNNLDLSEEEQDYLEDNINEWEEEGTNYDTLNFVFKDIPDFFLQVTALINYEGHRAGNYEGNCQWGDTGLFFVNYDDCDFEDLD